MQIWTGQQKKRLSRLLKWKQDQVDFSGGSAWSYLNRQRPNATQYLRVNHTANGPNASTKVLQGLYAQNDR